MAKTHLSQQASLDSSSDEGATLDMAIVMITIDVLKTWFELRQELGYTNDRYGRVADSRFAAWLLKVAAPAAHEQLGKRRVGRPRKLKGSAKNAASSAGSEKSPVTRDKALNSEVAGEKKRNRLDEVIDDELTRCNNVDEENGMEGDISANPRAPDLKSIQEISHQSGKPFDEDQFSMLSVVSSDTLSPRSLLKPVRDSEEQDLSKDTSIVTAVEDEDTRPYLTEEGAGATNTWGSVSHSFHEDDDLTGTLLADVTGLNEYAEDHIGMEECEKRKMTLEDLPPTCLSSPPALERSLLTSHSISPGADERKCHSTVAAEDQGIMQVACDDQEMLSPMQTHRSVLH